MPRYSKAEIAESTAALRKVMRKGSTVYVSVGHVSKSGMSRTIHVRTISRNVPSQWDFHVARVLGLTQREDGVRIDGCGMDMGFQLVYLLGRHLWPKGSKLPKGEHGRNGDKSGFETDGGYLLTHRWL